MAGEKVVVVVVVVVGAVGGGEHIRSVAVVSDGVAVRVGLIVGGCVAHVALHLGEIET